MFVKGQSGNPLGRPKGAKNFTTKVREALEKVADDNEEPQDIQLVRKIIELAKNGDQQMIKLVWNYLDGMPLQTIKDISDEDEPTDDDLRETLSESVGGIEDTSVSEEEREV